MAKPSAINRKHNQRTLLRNKITKIKTHGRLYRSIRHHADSRIIPENNMNNPPRIAAADKIGNIPQISVRLHAGNRINTPAKSRKQNKNTKKSPQHLKPDNAPKLKKAVSTNNSNKRR